MKKTTQPRPPQWATNLLRWYCKRELVEDLEGDLNEYFARNVQERGATEARLIYIIDVLKFFQPYLIRRPEFINLLTHWIMVGSYIRTSGRSIARNKLFSVINIGGLALSMSVGLLIIAMMSDLFSYDKFHEKHDRIYRVISQYEYNGKKDEDVQATTSFRAAKAIKESFAGVEDVAILKRDFAGDVTADETTIPLSGFWANDSFLKVFSFQLLQGNERTALKEPFTIVLTEKSAHKLFGHTNVLGKVVKMRQAENEREYTISGLMKDLPVFSHMKFEMLGSISTREVTEAGNDWETAWDNVWDTWAYVLLEDKRAAPALGKNLARLSEMQDKSVKLTRITLDLQPLDDIMTGKKLSNPIGQTMGNTVMWIFTAMAFIVILCAGLNYTNLSIARSIRRSREVGIRKTIGAQRSHVVNQFLVESLIIAMLALVAGFGLFLLIKPHFLSLESSLSELLLLDLSWRAVFMFVLFAIIVGLSAGIFPGVFFSRINAVQVLKNLSAVPMLKGLTMRKALIVFQYSISIIAITATLIMHKQYRHFIAYDLGFTTENILNIRLQAIKPELLKKKLLELPEVTGVSQSLMITSIGNFYGTLMKNPNEPQDSAGVNFNAIDENYLPLHDHKLLAGENFNGRPSKTPETEVIVNEQVLKRFNIGEQKAENAIGEVVTVDGQDLTIIGVMKDFQYGRANNHSGNAVIMRYAPDQAQYLNVKILSSDWPATYAKIEAIWKQLDKVHPLEARFYDEEIEAGFQGLNASMKVGSFVAFLVIAIASIGLLGMVVYTTETRIREVSIRKVFGATDLRLLYLLSKGFLFLVMIAAFFSLPVAYLLFDRVILPELVNHAPLGLFEMSAGAICVVGIALLMIASQTVKVVRTNPAEILKVE